MSAHAPYNFVPLNETVLEGKLVDHHYYDADKNTGYFDVNLTTITPLFVRGMRGATMPDDTKISEPFMLNGNPVIPGSSLRGMIRALVEIITFGKMHFVGDKQLYYRAIYGKDSLVLYYREQVNDDISGGKFPPHYIYPSTRLRAGYLEKVPKTGDEDSGWAIRPALNHENLSFALIPKSTAEKHKLKPTIWLVPPKQNHDHSSIDKKTHKLRVTLRVAEVSSSADGKKEKATIIFSQTAGRRHWYPAIYEPDSNATLISISKEIWDLYVADRDMKRGIPTRQIDNKGDPLFYLVDADKSLIFFGPTMFFRMPYKRVGNSIKTIHKLLPERLKNPDFVDYADAMFGYVSEDNTKKRDPVAYSGRISFSSATLKKDVENDVDYEKEIIRVLGEPKPTYYPHYVHQNGLDSKDAHHYDTGDAELSGHKLYWRKKVRLEQLDKELPKINSEKDNNEDVETHFYPLREGLQFSFRVHFENLTNAELGALSWALSLFDIADAHHMLGMAKPYGLGVIKLSPTLYLSQRQNRYKTLFNSNGSWHEPQKRANYMYFVNIFFELFIKETGSHFMKLPRINELLAMLTHMADSEDRTFQYMTIEPNEYRDRPVLPRPREVIE